MVPLAEAVFSQCRALELGPHLYPDLDREYRRRLRRKAAKRSEQTRTGCIQPQPVAPNLCALDASACARRCHQPSTANPNLENGERKTIHRRVAEAAENGASNGGDEEKPNVVPFAWPERPTGDSPGLRPGLSGRHPGKRRPHFLPPPKRQHESRVGVWEGGSRGEGRIPRAAARTIGPCPGLSPVVPSGQAYSHAHSVEARKAANNAATRAELRPERSR